MRLSIVVPALDEADGISRALAPLQPLRARDCEIIVVDGGSVDMTRAIAAPLADRMIVSARGRAAQMNAGADIAGGDVLLFLHADSRLAPAAIEAMLARLVSGGRRWGRFDVAIDGRSRWLPIIAAAMNLRSRLTGIATGDQAIFVDRSLFASVGAFADQPLMEDIELCRRLKRTAGRPLCMRRRVRTSGRRWDAHGAWRTIVAMWGLRFAYWRGASTAKLARRYESRGARGEIPLPTLQVFAKSPGAGPVKTRLATSIGEKRAAAIHRDLVERTLATAAAARAAGVVGTIELWCSPGTSAPGFVAWREHYAVELKAQPDGDLGARMRYALTSALARGERAILIGSDCPALTVDYLRRATVALDGHDAVFGPAEDGGYVLVGASRNVDVFAAMPWGTSSVMAATRKALRATQARWHELPLLWDVDRPEDLARWEAMRTQSENLPPDALPPASLPPSGASIDSR